MTTHTLAPSVTTSNDARGMLLGLIGVAIFSLTLPFTRLAVGGTEFAPNGLSPMFVALARALGAAVLAGAWLLWRRAPLDRKSVV